MEINGKKARLTSDHNMAYIVKRVVRKIVSKEEKELFRIGAGFRLVQVDWFYVKGLKTPLFYKTENIILSKGMLESLI